MTPEAIASLVEAAYESGLTDGYRQAVENGPLIDETLAAVEPWEIVQRHVEAQEVAGRDGRLQEIEIEDTAQPQVDPEVYDVLMRKVFPRQAHVATVAELPALFRQHR